MVDVGLGGYSGLVEVGRGGFSVVYRGHDDRFDREVAIKVLYGDVDPDTQRRFERECQAIGGLSWHPNIVTVYDAGATERGHLYLAMEYAPAGSLASLLAQRGALGWQEATAIGVRIAGALHAAHGAGRLHRDVKPENILVSRAQEPMLGDFGIAAVQTATGTATRTITASLAHAAPEVLDGESGTAASDVYSLGSTLFALMAGRAAFVRPGDASPASVLKRVVLDPVPDLREFGVPEAVWLVVEQAMQKDPGLRPATAEAFGRLLQAAQASLGAPVTDLVMEAAAPAPPVTVVEPAVELDEAPTSLVGQRPLDPAAPIAPVAPVDADEAMTRRRQPTTADPLPPPVAEPTPPGSRPKLVAAVLVALVVVIGGTLSLVIARDKKPKTSPTSAFLTTTTGRPATSSTTDGAASSTGRKPCVTLADPLPPGAPDVPVQTGPPPDKLVTEDLKTGTGAEVTASQTVTVNYIGVSCSTGRIFDSSYSRGQPDSFALSGVIPGWQQGLPGMRVGGRRLLGIPPALAYGSQGSPPNIAPDETLWFVIDVVDAK